MFQLIKILLVRFLLARYLIGGLGSLVVALPVAALLKSVGTPLLALLGIVAMPVFFILLIVGLPIFAVLLVAGGLLGVVAAVFFFGMAALKIFIVVVLPILAIVWLVRLMRGTSSRSRAPAAG